MKNEVWEQGGFMKTLRGGGRGLCEDSCIDLFLALSVPTNRTSWDGGQEAKALVLAAPGPSCPRWDWHTCLF